MKKETLVPTNTPRVKRGVIPGGGDLITKQEHGRDTDINFIMNNYVKQGIVPNFKPGIPEFGDFTMAMDLEAAIQLSYEARNAFMTWPAKARELADNDPVTGLEMLASEEGQEALRGAGLELPPRATAPSDPNPAVADPGKPGTVPETGVTQPN